MSQSTVDKTTQEKYYYVVTDQDGFVGKPVLVPSLEDESISFEQFYEDQIRKMYPYEEERDGDELTIFLTNEALYKIPESLLQKPIEQCEQGDHITDLLDDDEDREPLIVHSQNYVFRYDEIDEGEDHVHDWDEQSTVSSGAGVCITYWCTHSYCYKVATHDQGAIHPSTGVPVTSVKVRDMTADEEDQHDIQYQTNYHLEMSSGDMYDFPASGDTDAQEKAQNYIQDNQASFERDEKFDLWSVNKCEQHHHLVRSFDIRYIDEWD